METITIEFNDDGIFRVTEDEGDQTTEPTTQEFDSIGEAAEGGRNRHDLAPSYWSSNGAGQRHVEGGKREHGF